MVVIGQQIANNYKLCKWLNLIAYGCVLFCDAKYEPTIGIFYLFGFI